MIRGAGFPAAFIVIRVAATVCDDTASGGFGVPAGGVCLPFLGSAVPLDDVTGATVAVDGDASGIAAGLFRAEPDDFVAALPFAGVSPKSAIRLSRCCRSFVS